MKRSNIRNNIDPSTRLYIKTISCFFSFFQFCDKVGIFVNLVFLIVA